MENSGEDCPQCPNQGWYFIGTYGEQEQCEWCWANPDSKFAVNQDLCGSCGGSGAVDSGGVLPWGEAAMMECPECNYFRLIHKNNIDTDQIST